MGDLVDQQREAIESLRLEDIQAAFEEAKLKGKAAFLKEYGFGDSQKWQVIYGDEAFPTKPIVARAIASAIGGEVPSAKTFFGGFGETESRAALERLGYRCEAIDPRDDQIDWDAVAPDYNWLARNAPVGNVNRAVLYKNKPVKHATTWQSPDNDGQPDCRDVTEADGYRMGTKGWEDSLVQRPGVRDDPPFPELLDPIKDPDERAALAIILGYGARADNVYQIEPVIHADPKRANEVRLHIGEERRKHPFAITINMSGGFTLWIRPRAYPYLTAADLTARLIDCQVADNAKDREFRVNFRTPASAESLVEEVFAAFHRKLGATGEHNMTQMAPEEVEAAEPPPPDALPTNLILYGPPGTGKTFSTAAEAVRLCGEPVPQDRAELMAVYQRLVAAGRVEFVTFHQSMAYEDFVEGRQPMTGADGEGEAESAGFRLETVHGIFRRIAKRAETSRGRSSGDDMIRLEGRQVFKMSIGEANNPEDAHLFEEAIEGGYTLLGFDDIDWSDEKYASREAIFEACKDHRDGGGDIDSRSGWVQMPFRFRNWVRHGDIVIVSKGNQQFRAIGEFVGDYEFKPRPEGGYAHRRAVRWLWVDRDGVAVSEIYSRGFMQQSIYLLYDNELNIPALERYMNSQRNDGGDEPDQFVLIIDEINRANISKVFGELITLLEADKRLNQPNAVRVRLPYSGDEFGVPSNLHILGTMNTADRSIALLDTALRRRFTFREMMPDASILEDAGQKCGIDLPRLLTKINERIEYLYDREHQIGHAYFTACSSRADVDEVMRHKVIPLLAEYFFEDWDKIAAVLGDLEPGEGSITGGFLKRAILNPPPGLEDGDAVARFRWQVRSVDEGFDYTKLVGK